jgi:predicted RNA-binding Zn ribbon-like protein
MEKVGFRIPQGEVPDEIRLVNEFLNTQDLERFGEKASMPEEDRDELRDPERLRAWLVGRGLMGEDEPVAVPDLRLALAVRDALRSAVWANGRDVAEKADAPNRTFGELPLYLRLQEDGTPGLSPGGVGAAGVFGKMLADVAVAQARGTWARLKICASEDCRSVYYDHSKSRTGRWCSMRVCGNRYKTRRYRKRRNARTSRVSTRRAPPGSH